MDCRRFHRDLEDYLEDGLDFAGRFGMERHAKQCIGCGAALSNARRLRRMARQLEKVKAPANFESAVLSEIGRREISGGFLGLRRFWLYGLDMPSRRSVALAASCVAVLGFGILYLSPAFFNRAVHEKPVALVSPEPAKADPKADLKPAAAAVATKPMRPQLSTAVPKPKRLPVPPAPDQQLEQMVDQEATDADYLEFQVMGPDNQPVTFRWPNKPRNRYGQTREEYFFRNVSH